MKDSPKLDGRSTTSAQNGKLGGMPAGFEHDHKRTYDPTSLAEAAAHRVLTGKLISPTLGPVTDHDKRTIARITGESAETFQARISSKLEALADQTADLIASKLQEEPGSKTGFRPDTLPALLAISLDKLQALSGRSTSIGSVNIQINSIASDSRPTVLSNLRSLRGDRSTPQQESIAV